MVEKPPVALRFEGGKDEDGENRSLTKKYPVGGETDDMFVFASPYGWLILQSTWRHLRSPLPPRPTFGGQPGDQN